MALAIILFAGSVGIALVLLLAVLAFIDVAFNVWESAERADRDARYAAQPELAVQPAAAEASTRSERTSVHQWAQSA
jgi:hypothetical protein